MSYSSLEADVDAKLIKLSGEYQSLFDDKGSKCKPWASEQKLYCESLNEKLSCLKQKLSKAVTDIKNNFNTFSAGIKQIFCCQGEKENKKSEGEQKKGQKKKTGKTPGSCVQNNEEHYPGLNLWTIENLCFPEGYNISSTSQNFLCEEELNVDNLARLKRSAVEHFVHYEESRTICNGCV